MLANASRLSSAEYQNKSINLFEEINKIIFFHKNRNPNASAGKVRLIPTLDRIIRKSHVRYVDGHCS